MEGQSILSGLLTRILAIIIVLLIIGVVGGGAYLYHLYDLEKASTQHEIDLLRSKLDDCRSGKITQTNPSSQDMIQDATQENVQSSQEDTTQPQVLEDSREQTSTVWAVHTNGKYGFQMQYPNTWKALEYKDHIDFLPLIAKQVYVRASIYEVATISEARKSIEELNIPDTALTSLTEGVVINDISWTIMSVNDKVFRIAEKDGKVFVVSYLKTDSLGRQLAESFQFVR